MTYHVSFQWSRQAMHRRLCIWWKYNQELKPVWKNVLLATTRTCLAAAVRLSLRHLRSRHLRSGKHDVSMLITQSPITTAERTLEENARTSKPQTPPTDSMQIHSAYTPSTPFPAWHNTSDDSEIFASAQMSRRMGRTSISSCSHRPSSPAQQSSKNVRIAGNKSAVEL